MLQIFSSGFSLTRKFAYFIIAISTVCGCVSKTNQSEHNFAYVSLESTPFFPQSNYQCGPAALSTVLVYSGIAVSPGELIDKVYIPQRKGSLQIEMIAAAREYGRVAYLLNPELSTIIDELHQGRPVLVFQNIGWRIKPVWHYAVVIGYDPESEEILLRSGTNANTRLSVRKFLQSWQRADSWAFVALKPGELPVNVDFDRYFQAIADMSNNTSAEYMLELYLKTSRQFPDEALVWFALGNTYVQLKKPEQAARAYLKVLALDPGHIAGRNNLAYILNMLSCYDQALEHAKEAVRLSAFTHQYELESRDTLKQIKADIDNGDNKTSNCKFN